MSSIVGEETVLIDMRSGYDLAEINKLFSDLGPEGRGIHRKATMITDMIFPFTYGLLFVLLSAFFLKKIFDPTSNWMYLSLAPIALMIVDFKENLNTLDMIDTYPDLNSKMVSSAATVTDLKSILVNVCMLLPLILAGVWLYKKRSRR